MTKRIVIVSSQAASFDYYRSLSARVRENNFCLEWWILAEHEEFFKKTFAQEYTVIDERFIQSFDPATSNNKPALFLLGMGVEAPDKISPEKMILTLKESWGIPMISGLDSWVNYEGRMIRSDKPIFADRTMVIDKKSFYALQRLGIPAGTIEIVGQPFFDDFCDHNPRIKKQRSGKFVFASQPIKRYFGNSLGFNEHSVLKDFLTTLSPPPPEFKTLSIRLHPENTRDDFYQLVRNAPIDLRVDYDLEWRDAELIVSMSSTLLILGRLLDIPAISYRPGNKLPNSSFGNPDWLVSTSSLERLTYAVHNYPTLGKGNIPYKKVGSSVDRIWRIMEPYIAH
jgi:hypothetical protein